ncbi:MAG: glycosyltransferase [Bdellovibrionota bacterium]|jgi:glycosyltransferase involved in cell wall biosynthesis
MNTKPVIVIFFNDWKVYPHGINAGGGESATMALAHEFVKLGHRVIACANLPEGETEKNGIEFWNFGVDYALHQIEKRLRDLPAYHCFCATLVHPLLLLREHKNCLSRIIINHAPSAYASGLEPATVMQLIDFMTCVSDAQRNMILLGRNVDPKKIVVVRNGFNPDVFTYAGPEGRDWNQLIFIGRIEPPKGIHVLVQVFSELKKDFPNLKLSIFGDENYWPDFIAQKRDLERGLSGLKFHGKVPQPLLAQHLRKAGLLVFPSISFESAGLAVVDAQASGCPVVAFNQGGVSEYLVPQLGDLVTDISSAALKDAITKMLLDEKRRIEISKQAEVLGRERPWSKVALEVLKYADLALSSKNTPVLEKRSQIKVSALVSLYNSMEYVEELFKDLTAQSLFKKGKMEIVVIDSNSPQNEKEVVERYQAQFPNIVYLRTDHRETLYQAWNRGIALAQGEFLTNANSDDRHHPEALEIMLNSLESNPEIDLVYADVYESTIPNEPFLANKGSRRYYYPEYFPAEALLAYQFGCQPLWRKSVHDKMGEFSTSLKAAGDWDFCMRFALAGLKALHINQVLGSFSNRPTSISTQDDTSVREQAEVKNRYLTPQNILALYEKGGWKIQSAADKAKVFTDFAKRALKLRLPWEPETSFIDLQSATLAIQAAFEAEPDNPKTAWNFGIILHLSGNPETAENILNTALQSGDTEVLKASQVLSKNEKLQVTQLNTVIVSV